MCSWTCVAQKTKVNSWNMFIFKWLQPHINSVHFCILGSTRCRYLPSPRAPGPLGRPICKHITPGTWQNDPGRCCGPGCNKCWSRKIRQSGIVITCQRSNQHRRKWSGCADSQEVHPQHPSGEQPGLERACGQKPCVLWRAWCAPHAVLKVWSVSWNTNNIETSLSATLHEITPVSLPAEMPGQECHLLGPVTKHQVVLPPKEETNTVWPWASYSVPLSLISSSVKWQSSGCCEN